MATDERQSSLADIRLEDPEMEDYLRLAFDNAEAHAQYTGGQKGAKELLKTRHKNVVNSDDDGIHSGWVLCGNYRFRPRNRRRPQDEVTINVSEGVTWQPLEIERL